MKAQFVSVELVSVIITEAMRNDSKLAIISDNTIYLVAEVEYAKLHYPDLNWEFQPTPTVMEYKEMYPEELAKLGL